MQCAVIDFARNVCNIKNANSTEFSSRAKNPVVDIMHTQKSVKIKGASMRLGSYPCDLIPKTKVRSAYNKFKINERHRHRYEVNNRFRKQLEKNGLVVSGVNKDLDLVEIIELRDHPWFVGVQFHPELKSRVLNPHPLFRSFIASCVESK